MHKHFFFFLSLVCITSTIELIGQNNYSSVTGSVTYTFNKDLGVPVSNDWTLFFDQDLSLFTGATDLKYLKKLQENNAVKNIKIKSEAKLIAHLFVDQNRDSIFSQGLVYKTPYYIKDYLPSPVWELRDETKKINGFLCQRAIGEFRGRTYDVWFTASIPVNFGPWKLTGLPGLILYAKDTTGSIEFIAKNIDLGKQNDAVLEKYKRLPKVGEIKSLRQFMELKDKEYLEFHKASIARSPRQENTTIEVIPAGRTYKMEVTFEWENED